MLSFCLFLFFNDLQYSLRLKIATIFDKYETVSNGNVKSIVIVDSFDYQYFGPFVAYLNYGLRPCWKICLFCLALN